MSNAAPFSNPPRWVHRRGPKTLGVVMIVKNEAHNLPELFETIAQVADEVVVVDTGSSDGTQTLCKHWGVTLLSDPWRDDFSRPRNRGISASTSRYLIWLDADDRLPPQTQRELIRLRDQVLVRAEPRAYEMEIHNEDASGMLRDRVLQVRIFPRHPKVRFQHIIHEELVTSLRAAGIPREVTEMAIVHTGYASPEMLRRKHARNEALLRKSLQDNGVSVHHLVHLAHAVGGTGRLQEGEAFITQAIEVQAAAGDRPQLLAELYTFRARFRASLSNRFGAVRDLEQAIALWPGWGLAPGMLAQLLLEGDDEAGALEHVHLARTGTYPVSEVALPVRRMHADMECAAGNVHLRRDERDPAIASFLRALEIDPGYLHVRLQVGQLLLDSEQFETAREVLEPAGEDEGAVPHFVDLASGIGLARAVSGDLAGASACLSPLVELLSTQLNGAEDVNPLQLSAAALLAGYPAASRNLLSLFEKTLAAAA
jgi:tetratricopeptide (TPR) repeat protein